MAALPAYDWLAKDHKGQIFVHGYSLGAGGAMYVAANQQVGGDIWNAPFARLCDLMTGASYLSACYPPMVRRWNMRAGYLDKCAVVDAT